MTTIDKLVRIAECVNLYGDFGSDIRHKLAIEFLAYINVRPEQLLPQTQGQWAHLHDKLREFERNNKIGAIKWFREEVAKRVNFVPSLLYSKRYVEWVWEGKGWEPKWDNIPF